MLKKFIPTKRIKRFDQLNVQDLIDNNKKLLLCDIDNTLVAPDDPFNNEEVLAFIKKIKDANIEVVLISNNNEERVRVFNDGLNLKTYPLALKPLKKTYKQIFKDFKHLKKSEMISLGDQVMTDVYGSNKVGIDVVLTGSIVQTDMKVTKFNRYLEDRIINRLRKKGMWPNEEM